MWLLVIAAVGFIIPNGLFINWLVVDYHGVAAVMQDKLAIAFILDAFMTLVLLSVYFARKPIGAVRWHWFTLLSILGGLGFGLPLYYWLNTRPHRGTA